MFSVLGMIKVERTETGLYLTKGQGSRRVKIGPVAEIYDFMICCRIIYLMKKNVIFICFALKLCDIVSDK